MRWISAHTSPIVSHVSGSWIVYERPRFASVLRLHVSLTAVCWRKEVFVPRFRPPALLLFPRCDSSDA